MQWDNTNSILYIDGSAVYTGTPATGSSGGGFFDYGTKTYHFYNEGTEVGRINDGYENTAFGESALSAITPDGSYGHWNTAVGYHALMANTLGESNVVVGSECLATNTVGDYNIGIGDSALYENIDGSDNIAIGCLPMYENIDGCDNVAIGDCPLCNTVTDSEYNVAIGPYPMCDFVGGIENVAIGESPFGGYGTGEYNIAIGAVALGSATNEDAYDYGNVAIGGYALWGWNRFGRAENVAIGYEAMTLGHVAHYNVSIGSQSLKNCYGEELSVAVGLCSLQNQVAGYGNVGVGAYSGKDSINLKFNTFLGYDTGTDQMNGHTSTVAKHYHDITPDVGIEKSYVEYAYSFVFDGVDESNLIPDGTYYGLPGSYGDGKTYEMHLTAVPTCTTTDSPRTCTASKIYRYYIYKLIL
jgi:hypothetical protein